MVDNTISLAGKSNDAGLWGSIESQPDSINSDLLDSNMIVRQSKDKASGKVLHFSFLTVTVTLSRPLLF